MAELKQSRWVKIHEPGNANFDEKDNIMDIVVGSNRCQAEATFTARSFRKAAYWLHLNNPKRVETNRLKTILRYPIITSK